MVKTKTNLPPLRLHIPEPKFRPGDEADFSDVVVPEIDAIARPDESSAPATIQNLAFGLIRVLDNNGNATGSWNPGLGAGSVATDAA